MILEEELKNTVAGGYFDKFDCTGILGKIDFAVKPKRPKNAIDFDDEYLLWAEAKATSTDVVTMLAQLVLTVGKARTFDKIMPPPFLGCFDCEKIAFVPYSEIQSIFYQNDFNWKVAPSDTETREFRQVYEKVKKIIDSDTPWETYLFDFERDEAELRRFIRENFIVGKIKVGKTRIDKNNFIAVYSKWLEAVKPTVAVNWDIAKKNNIIDGDFYLADLLSAQNEQNAYSTIKENLFVLLKSTCYETNRHIDALGLFTSSRVGFTDGQRAHTLFWNKYERPPQEEYWNYIVERRDLLVPQDVRERKGSFFTPQIWVELSQRYIADVLGEDWQEEYYVWDCAAGTGNLLNGLTNKYNIWASTLDRQDVDVMRDRIKNGANLLESHVFQFDFLNDDFSKLPQGLRDIISDERKRKKLVIYINPPYAEGDNVRGLGRKDVQVSKIHDKYRHDIGKASGELFAQFLTRIYCEIPAAKIANFSKLKILHAPNFENFRSLFQAKIEKMFVVPADTFDNVAGRFPIGFFVWDTAKQEKFERSTTDVFDKSGNFTKTKGVYSYDNAKYISDWLEANSKNISKSYIGHLASVGNDFQNQRMVFIDDVAAKRKGGGRHTMISAENLVAVSVYFAVRKVIPADWLNDRDQFLFPNKKWEKDIEFQNDCLAYTLFSNNIQSKYGVNHWIPFTEYQVGARDKFDSNFMTDFIAGKTNTHVVSEPELFYYAAGSSSGGGYKRSEYEPKERIFSPIAKAVFDAGKELWKYYHSQKDCNVNASFYDIREYFQGRNAKGKMNSKSDDEKYGEQMGSLRASLKALAGKIEPKVYEHGFMKE